jgi:hypothetical protein
MKVTVFLGAKGNNFILNGKLKDLNAEVRAHEDYPRLRLIYGTRKCTGL